MLLNAVLDRDAHIKLNGPQKPMPSSSSTHCPAPTCKHTVICRPLLWRLNNRMYVLGDFYFSLVDLYFLLFQQRPSSACVVFHSFKFKKKLCFFHYPEVEKIVVTMPQNLEAINKIDKFN